MKKENERYEKEQVLNVTKGDFLGSASGAVVLTALIVFLSSVLV
ncbi:DUF3948 domain-containing protein [Bacillus mycoides]|uniref:DUF3948 domain-containing protein n=1 Tax=Bacillus mycoides TaxID=1405 RepID=A0A1S9T3J6_BACMY|nr:DUF3948 family protein [Bacillus mycoides]OOR04520.1 DUF3948 domain-containing protein [Bacillus mycoides]